MLFKSGILTQASGSIGGITASHNRGGMYFRARAIPTDPNTGPQATMRAILGSLADRWNNTLITAERDAWNLYASLTTVIGPLGDPLVLSGQQTYIRSNSVRAQNAQGIVDAAPTQFDLGELGVPTLDAAGTGPLGNVDIGFDNTLPWANDDDGFMAVLISRPQNPSINYFRGPYRNSGGIQGITIGPPTSPATINAAFPFTAGQRVFVKLRVTEADGRLTQSIYLGPVVVA